MADFCAHCMFLRMATLAQDDADRWKKDGLLCLATPRQKIALEMEASAAGEPKVCQGEKPRSNSKWLDELLSK
jgi:hypothetical protein